MKPLAIDWKNPDYGAVLKARMVTLRHLRERPERFAQLKAYYAAGNYADFINDWGVTFDPRNAERGLPTLIPFILFAKQRDWIAYVLRKWRAQEPGLCEKSRDMGVSWLAMALSCTLCLFNDGIVIGVGSRKTIYVDKVGEHKPLLPKARMFMANLPQEFRGDWQAWRDAPNMRVAFPSTGSLISGEGGDDIGRGDRTSIYFVDEAAHMEHPELVDASLSQTTNCRIDMSSVRGMANPFARKRWGGKIEPFIFDWRAQPLDAKLLTPAGWCRMGDVAIGDNLIGIDGKPVKVVGVYPQGKKEVFRVSFSDGSSAECCDDHLWSVIPYGNQRVERRHIRHVMPLREIRKDFIEIDSRGWRKHRYQVPLVSPIEFDPADIPLHPYVLGCLLGDGSLPTKSSSAIGLTLGPLDKEIAELVEARLPPGCTVKQDREIQFRISANRSYQGGVKGRGCHNPVNEAIRTLGLVGKQSHDKFIPEIYQRSSTDQRIDLIRGLMDTDGCIRKNDPGVACLTTVSKQLAQDIAFISQTLGGVAKVREVRPPKMAIFGNRTCQRREFIYRVDVRLPDGIIPFLLARKAAAYAPPTRYPPRRSITGIDPIGPRDCQCIKVDSDDGLYLTNDCVVTHNSDPRKDDAWYAKQCETLDPVVVAQEIDRDYAASVKGVVIPGTWVRSAIGAKRKLGIAPSGIKRVAFDVADEGEDLDAVCVAEGTSVMMTEEWSGKGGDVFGSTEYVFDVCDDNGVTEFRYDSDGIGAGVRGDARVINERRKASGARQIRAIGYRGSGAVFDPDGVVEGTIGLEGDKGRTNKDYFQNAKAQNWWGLRRRFQRTHRWVTQGIACAPDDIIDLDDSRDVHGNLNNPTLMKLVAELSQATYRTNELGKIVIEKKPGKEPSPNLADAVVIDFAEMESAPVEITGEMLRQIANAGRRRR